MGYFAHVDTTGKTADPKIDYEPVRRHVSMFKTRVISFDLSVAAGTPK